jgi:hypothetical protein
MKSNRNLWPWAIVLTFVLFISGTVSLVVMACSQKVELVSQNYYEQELQFQRASVTTRFADSSQFRCLLSIRVAW